MKYLLKSLTYAGSLLFSFLTVKLSRYAASILPFLSTFDANNITDMICVIVPFFTGIAVEFFKSRKEKELLRQEHEHQLAMQAKTFENDWKKQEENHKAAIAEIEKNAALALEHQRLAWIREDQVAEEAKRRERLEDFRSAYSSMTDAVIDYINMQDVNYKTAAEKAVRNLLPHTQGELKKLVLKLGTLISNSDAFDGPHPQETRTLLHSIEQHLSNNSANQKEDYDHQYSF